MNTIIIQKITEIVEANFSDELFGSRELAEKMGINRIQLYRKLKAATNKSASEFIREFRLKKGKELLENEELHVSEVAFRVGFASPTYFSRCFHDYYGFPPGKIKDLQEISDDTLATNKTINKRFIAVSIFILVALAVIISIVIKPFTFQQKEFKKSIAVLPFIDDSPEEGSAYIINGLMEEILNKLQKIEELSVKSRTDSEKYRDSKKSTTEIAKELNVGYILEGSGQKINNRIMLRLQLIEAKTGNHLWSNPYEKEVNDENIFSLQQDVALSVATELRAQISNEEESLIEKLPTENTAAYHQYLKGLEHIRLELLAQKRSNYSESWEQVNMCKKCFEQAIVLDSTFSDAFAQLGYVYTNKLYYKAENDPQLMVSYMDSAFYYSKKALEFESDNIGALTHLIRYYSRKGMNKEAMEIEKQWMKLAKKVYEPFMLYREKFSFHYDKIEFYDAIKYYHKYLESKPSSKRTPFFIRQRIYKCYESMGFPQLAMQAAKEILNIDNDSIGYWMKLDMLTYFYDSTYNPTYINKWFNKDSTHNWVLNRLSWHATNQRKFIDAYSYMQKSGTQRVLPRQGYIYLQNGYLEEANKIFEDGINRYLKEIEFGVPNAQHYLTHSDLINIYSILGNKEKALEYLRQTKNRKTFVMGRIKELNISPMLDNIRDEPEFQEFLIFAEAKFQREHERIEKQLRDLGEIE